MPGKGLFPPCPGDLFQVGTSQGGRGYPGRVFRVAAAIGQLLHPCGEKRIQAVAHLFRQERRAAGHGLEDAEIELPGRALVEDEAAAPENGRVIARGHEKRDLAPKRLQKGPSGAVDPAAEGADERDGHIAWYTRVLVACRIAKKRQPFGRPAMRRFLEKRQVVALRHAHGVETHAVGHVPGVHVLVHGIADDHGGQGFQPEDPGNLAAVAPEDQIRGHAACGEKLREPSGGKRFGQRHVAAGVGADGQDLVAKGAKRRDKCGVVQVYDTQGAAPISSGTLCRQAAPNLPEAPRV